MYSYHSFKLECEEGEKGRKPLVITAQGDFSAV